jgi:hypothetical protein
MKEIASNLQRGNIKSRNFRTIRKTLQHLIDVTRFINERDYEKEKG